MLDCVDMLLVQTVLTTHSQFVSAPELLQLLLARFHIQLPPDATADDRAFFSQHHRGIQVKYVTRTLAPARCGGGGGLARAAAVAAWHVQRGMAGSLSSARPNRVLQALVEWIKLSWVDFEQHEGMVEQLETFLEQCRALGFQNEASVVARTMSLKSMRFQKRIVVARKKTAPPFALTDATPLLCTGPCPMPGGARPRSLLPPR